MEASVSEVLRTHNPRADYFGRVLYALRAQTIPLNQWDFLIVDNASDERVSDLWDLSWHPCARHIREDDLGLTAARLRGIKESSSELVVFVDDDNVLAPDFLEQARVISAGYSHLGTLAASPTSTDS